MSQAPFFVFEGVDGAGTTTQTALLAQRLAAAGRQALTTREPSDGPIGVMIRQMLALRIAIPTPDGGVKPMTRQTLALLFAADRLDHLAARVEPALEAGRVVLSDRYLPSSLAYQGDVEPGEDGQPERVDYEWVWSLNQRARQPTLTFFLRVEVQESLRRLGQRPHLDLYETREKLERLVLRYDEVMAMLAAQGHPVVTLDASQPIDALHEQIWARVEPLLP